jgi:hypothetical protein
MNVMDESILNLFKSIRGLVYDRTPAPLIHLKLKDSSVPHVFSYEKDFATPEKVAKSFFILWLKNASNEEVKLGISTNILSDMLEALTALNSPVIQVATSWNYDEYFATSETVAISPIDLKDNLVTIYAKKLFTDRHLLDIIQKYFLKFSTTKEVVTYENFKSFVDSANLKDLRHLSLWCAYYLVEQRRLQEYLEAKGGHQFTNSNSFGEVPTIAKNVSDFSTSVTVGDVFSLSEQDPARSSRWDKVSKDNIFDDFNGFWWKYQQHLKLIFEREFGDYSLRTNDGYTTKFEVENLSWYNAHYLEHPHNFNFYPHSKIFR